MLHHSIAPRIPHPSMPGYDASRSQREAFADFLSARGFVVDGPHPIMDGQRHRIAVEGDKGGPKSGIYNTLPPLVEGNLVAYCFNFRTQEQHKFSSRRAAWTPLSPAQAEALRVARAECTRKAYEERLKQQEGAARRATRRLARRLSVADSGTSYTRRKGIVAAPGLYSDASGRTHIPAYDINGKIWTLQTIHEDSTKTFTWLSRKKECFHVLGGLDALDAVPVIIIAEGYATAATVRDSVGFATVTAFDCHNLVSVATALRQKYPSTPIIIAGDDDVYEGLISPRKINPGRKGAEDAARAVGGRAIFPAFAPEDKADESKDCKDWNDLATKSAVSKAAFSCQIAQFFIFAPSANCV